MNWEVRVRVWAHQMMRVLSREEEARRRPSLENLTQETAREWPISVRRGRYGRYGAAWVVAIAAK